jgi:hypothetical protein
MTEISLITIADVQKFRRIDSKFNQEKFDAYLNEVQRNNLRNLLGDALYYAFMNDDKISGIYKDLLDGKVYNYDNTEIQYFGLKPFISYCWLSIAVREGDLFISTTGPVNFANNPQRHFELSKEKERIAIAYTEIANDYANDIIKFLNENNENYPLWKNKKETNSSEFITFKL